MKKQIKTIVLATLLAGSGSVFAQTIVTVNGIKIDSSDIERRAKIVQTQSKGQISDSPELRQYLTNQMITEILVSQEAKRLKLDKSTEYTQAEAESMKVAKTQGADKQSDFKQRWADHQNQLLMMVYAANVLKQNPVTDVQVQQQYRQIQSRYQGSDEVQLGEIISNQANHIDAALKELNSKKSFTEVAKKYSMNPDAKTTGGIVPDYIPLVDLKQDNPMVYQAISNLNKGQFTKTPLKDGNVQLIIYMNDKRKISVPAFEQIKEGLMADMQDEKIAQAIDALGKKAKIVPAK